MHLVVWQTLRDSSQGLGVIESRHIATTHCLQLLILLGMGCEHLILGDHLLFDRCSPFIVIVVRCLVPLHLRWRGLGLAHYDTLSCAIVHLLLTRHLLVVRWLQLMLALNGIALATTDLIAIALQLDLLAGWESVARGHRRILLYSLLIRLASPLALCTLLVLLLLLLL